MHVLLVQRAFLSLWQVLQECSSPLVLHLMVSCLTVVLDKVVYICVNPLLYRDGSFSFFFFFFSSFNFMRVLLAPAHGVPVDGQKMVHPALQSRPIAVKMLEYAQP